MSKKPILEVVGSAIKPKKDLADGGGSGSGGAGGGDDEKHERFSNYLIKNNSFYQEKPTRDGVLVPIKLGDFTCKIIQEIVTDDGLSDTSFLRLEGKR